MALNKTVLVYGFVPTEKHPEGEAAQISAVAPHCVPLDGEQLIMFTVGETQFTITWRNLKSIVRFFETFEVAG